MEFIQLPIAKNTTVAVNPACVTHVIGRGDKTSTVFIRGRFKPLVVKAPMKTVVQWLSSSDTPRTIDRT